MSEQETTARPTEPFAGPIVTGSPAERARATLAAFPERTAALAEAARRSAGEPIDPDLARWVERSYAVLDHFFPEVAEYLEATADALDVDLMAMFTRSHRKVVRQGFVLTPGPNDGDGCSTGAGRHADVGAWIVKNRDNNQESLERQIVVEHVDPAWGGRRAITVANLGGCMANSSGINSAGFAVVDTAVTVADTPPGIFRAFLLDGLLGRCTTVAEAIDIIESVPHLGGTATFADATGAIATADLATDGAVVRHVPEGGTTCRTNHFDPEIVARGSAESDTARANSLARLATVGGVVRAARAAPRPWPEFREWLCDRMLDHDGPGALCKHDPSGALTISTTVYSCSPPTMLTSMGPGCVSPWVEWSA
jgi:isopenicillin-N N-acyltransferase like protein